MTERNEHEQMEEQQFDDSHLAESDPPAPIETASLSELSPRVDNASLNSSGSEPDEQGKGLAVLKAAPVEELPNLAPFGNNIVFLDNKNITITIGPDYICFIPTFLTFCTISFLLTSFIYNNADSLVAKIVTTIVCLGECLAYLLVALSDPGIARPNSNSQKTALTKTTFCRRCRFDVPQPAFHCSYCNVCIMGYDHHCPWTSKCIGQKNLIKFYVFLFMTPVFIVYCAFAFGFTVQQSGPAHHNLQKVIQPKF